MSSLIDNNSGSGTSIPGQRGSSKGTTIMPTTGGGTTLVGAVGSKVLPDAAPDPVVGWLVVISGPGQGHGVNLGMGMNIIGRGHRNRVVLDFGDTQISEDDHFRITYDREGRDFRLILGRGTNLLYLSQDKSSQKAAVYETKELVNGSEIKVGQTIMRFVALCGTDWDWSDVLDGKEQA